MISVQNITSEIFNSNVYLITSSEHEEVFLIDCGGFDPIINALPENAVVKGIFLTHYHYDHIYFINKWIKKYPAVTFYGTEITLQGLSNPKRNLSLYHGDPIQIVEINFKVLIESDNFELFKNNFITSYVTEGHCEGSLTFRLENFVFTGDALIPNVAIVTKLRTGNKQLAKESVEKIKLLCQDNFIICPGHLNTWKSQNVDWNFYLNE